MEVKVNNIQAFTIDEMLEQIGSKKTMDLERATGVSHQILYRHRKDGNFLLMLDETVYSVKIRKVKQK